MVTSSIKAAGLPPQFETQKLSQILVIPRFQISKKKRKLTILHAHGRLINNSTFEAEVQAKENQDGARILEAEEKKRAKEEESKKKRRKKKTTRLIRWC